jgi:ethanolamine utilization protein EutA
MAAGLRPKDDTYRLYLTPGTTDIPTLPGMTISFSGGVADCIGQDIPPTTFGDLGPLLGKAIRHSRLCQGPYRLGTHTIRATVIGAGCHSAQLSGSTIFRQNTPLPLQNLPVTVLTPQEQEDPNLLSLICQKASTQDTPGILFFPGWRSPSYSRVTALADTLSRLPPPIRIVLEADMAKALGNALSLRLPPDTPILCIDGLSIGEDSYLDIGAPIGPALTTITKTLIFEK